MRADDKNIFIIVPCYNEASRLATSLKDFLGSPYRFIFVDDGSEDGTLRTLKAGVSLPNYLVSLDKNYGKAEAIRRGMEFLKTAEGFDGAEWIGYWDADMATPLAEVERLLEYERISGGADTVYGSRVMRLGSVIRRNALRHIAGRIFCTFISVIFSLKSYDTQCGAKLFRKKAALAAFAEPFVSRWIFDVEVILRLRNFKQLECPLGRWEDVKGSKLASIKAIFSVAADVARLISKYK